MEIPGQSKTDSIFKDAIHAFKKYKYPVLNAMVLLCAGSLKLFAQEKPKPNVIFIISDDLNMHLNAYGNRKVISPNIDRLASQGIRFERAYCNFPVSLASRSSFLTGIRPERTKVLGNRGDFRNALPHAVTLPRYFHDQGYLSVSCGKVLYPPGQDDQFSWDMKLADFLDVTNPATNPAASWGNLMVMQRDGSKNLFTFNDVDNLIDPEREQIRKLRSHQPAERVHFWGPSELSDDEMPDGQIATAACTFLELHQKTPFFLAVGFMKPHVHFVVPKKYFDLYNIDSIPKIDYSSNAELRDLEIGLKNASNSLSPGGRISPEMGQRAILAYYASISFMDAQVGKLLDKLKELKMDKNTIIVFIGDNGFLLGNHGWGKPTLYEDDVRIPLIVSAPGTLKPGSMTNQLVELVDLYPTLAELCGLPSPPNLDGTSFAPLMLNASSKGKQVVFSTTGNQRMVRTAKYKYTIYNEGEAREQLFDVEEDPLEKNNLINNTSMKSILSMHRTILSRHLVFEKEAIEQDSVARKKFMK